MPTRCEVISHSPPMKLDNSAFDHLREQTQTDSNTSLIMSIILPSSTSTMSVQPLPCYARHSGEFVSSGKDTGLGPKLQLWYFKWQIIWFWDMSSNLNVETEKKVNHLKFVSDIECGSDNRGCKARMRLHVAQTVKRVSHGNNGSVPRYIDSYWQLHQGKPLAIRKSELMDKLWFASDTKKKRCCPKACKRLYWKETAVSMLWPSYMPGEDHSPHLTHLVNTIAWL